MIQWDLRIYDLDEIYHSWKMVAFSPTYSRYCTASSRNGKNYRGWECPEFRVWNDPQNSEEVDLEKIVEMSNLLDCGFYMATPKEIISLGNILE
ncbi:unnamed protein product [Hymenolepis diminuta]|uniref:Phage protein n=1 Tax=Hymenolepis diminuta TaxID=6216 RepID=A0A0R3SQW3_HYMDI|nr:unnamed protein product [Hymenolepis diminuta]